MIFIEFPSFDIYIARAPSGPFYVAIPKERRRLLENDNFMIETRRWTDTSMGSMKFEARWVKILFGDLEDLSELLRGSFCREKNGQSEWEIDSKVGAR